MGLRCVECNAIDKFTEDEQGYPVCTACGLTYGRNCCVSPEFCDDYDDPTLEKNQQGQSVETMDKEEVLDEGKVAIFKGTYARRAHLNERLSAVLLSDPELSGEVKQLLQIYWTKLCSRDYWTQLRFKQHLINKGDIRKLLRFIDSREMPRKKYTIQYLEKWKSIREFLTGQKGLVYSPEQVSKVGSVFMKLSGIWDFWQPPAWKKERTVWKFKERKHFPNFNFIFRKIHSLLGEEYKKFNQDFPLPANLNSRKKLERYWQAILPQLCSQNLIKFKKTRQLTISESLLKIQKNANINGNQTGK